MAEPPVQSGADGVNATPRPTGHQWLDMVLALSAIFISVISLFVAIEHGRTEAKLVAASSWPFLIYDGESDGLVPGSRQLILQVRNSGVGPARIQSARVMLDGKPIHNRIELMAASGGGFPPDFAGQVARGLYSENPLTGVLAARDTVEMLVLREMPGNAAQWNGLHAAMSRIVFSVCYCSVLDECWTTNLRSTADPTRVAKCAPGPDDYTE